MRVGFLQASGSAVQDIIKRDYKHGTVPAVFIGGEWQCVYQWLGVPV